MTRLERDADLVRDAGAAVDAAELVDQDQRRSARPNLADHETTPWRSRRSPASAPTERLDNAY